MARRRRAVKGAAKVRRLMKRMPEAVQREMRVSLEAAGQLLGETIRARTPRRTGELSKGIRHKVFPTTLKMQVGLIGSKKIREGLFYGRILEFGRRAQTVRVTRGTTVSKSYSARNKRAAGATLAKPYLLRVKAIAPMRFVTGPLVDLRAVINREIKDIWQRSLAKVAEGGDE